MRPERDVPENARTFIIQEAIRNAEMISKKQERAPYGGFYFAFTWKAIS